MNDQVGGYRPTHGVVSPAGTLFSPTMQGSVSYVVFELGEDMQREDAAMEEIRGDIRAVLEKLDRMIEEKPED